MVKVLLSAENSFKVKGDDGKLYKLSEIYQNYAAFLLVDDRILFMLKNSTSEELCETRELLQNFEQRKLPKFVCGISIDNYENKIITEDKIKQDILSACPNFDESQIMVKINCVHRGLGIEKRPIELIRVYNKRNLLDCQLKEFSKVWFKYNTIPTGGKVEANIYTKYGASIEQVNNLQVAVTFLEKYL